MSFWLILPVREVDGSGNIEEQSGTGFEILRRSVSETAACKDDRGGGQC